MKPGQSKQTPSKYSQGHYISSKLAQSGKVCMWNSVCILVDVQCSINIITHTLVVV